MLQSQHRKLTGPKKQGNKFKQGKQSHTTTKHQWDPKIKHVRNNEKLNRTNKTWKTENEGLKFLYLEDVGNHQVECGFRAKETTSELNGTVKSNSLDLATFFTWSSIPLLVPLLLLLLINSKMDFPHTQCVLHALQPHTTCTFASSHIYICVYLPQCNANHAIHPPHVKHNARMACMPCSHATCCHPCKMHWGNLDTPTLLLLIWLMKLSVGVGVGIAPKWVPFC